MSGTLLQEKTFLGGYWIKHWPRVSGEWELRDSTGLTETFATEQEMNERREEIIEAYFNSPRYRVAFEQKFGTD